MFKPSAAGEDFGSLEDAPCSTLLEFLDFKILVYIIIYIKQYGGFGVLSKSILPGFFLLVRAQQLLSSNNSNIDKN